ncbi:MAG: hypothetical protein U9R32_02160 [Bacteroidota bacterium]|nr:hypothetical protein [Bacteroidota bacterium]
MEYITISGIVYLFFVIVLANIAGKRKIGGLKVMLISLFLTPLTGLLTILLSKKTNLVHITGYICPKCGYEFTEYMEYCPNCSVGENQIKLKKISYKSL